MKALKIWSLAGAVALLVSLPTYAAKDICYVDNSTLGQSLDGLTIRLNGETTGVRPTSMVVEQNKGYITGVVMVYPDSVSLEDIRTSLNRTWSHDERKTNRTDAFAWRNEELGFVASVGKDGNNKPSLTLRLIHKI